MKQQKIEKLEQFQESSFEHNLVVNHPTKEELVDKINEIIDALNEAGGKKGGDVHDD